MSIVNKNIVRNIKLSILGFYTIKDEEKDLYNFVKQNLLGLKAVELDDFKDFIIYFNNDDKNIFLHDLKTNDLWVNDVVWSKFEFEFEFGYDYNEIKDIVKGVVEQAYKLKGITPKWQHHVILQKIEQAYKIKKIYITT